MLHANGFLVRSIREMDKTLNRQYMGVEGNSWPLFEIEVPTAHVERLNRCVKDDVILFDRDVADVSVDLDFVLEYERECKRNGIDSVILLCETSFASPQVHYCGHHTRFLGYDYADMKYDYYSCVFNDVFGRKILEFAGMELNQYGLFNELDDVTAFAELRNRLQENDREWFYERGDFVIARVSQVMVPLD